METRWSQKKRRYGSATPYNIPRLIYLYSMHGAVTAPSLQQIYYNYIFRHSRIHESGENRA